MYPRRTLANTKLPPKTDRETIPTNSSVHKRLSYDCAPPSLDSKIGHYFSSAAYRASLYRPGTETMDNIVRGVDRKRASNTERYTEIIIAILVTVIEASTVYSSAIEILAIPTG